MKRGEHVKPGQYWLNKRRNRIAEVLEVDLLTMRVTVQNYTREGRPTRRTEMGMIAFEGFTYHPFEQVERPAWVT